jgi:hypothetical protein
VLCGADEGVFGADEGTAPVGHRHVIGRHLLLVAVQGDHELDANLARRVVKAEAARLHQFRIFARPPIPRLGRQPGTQQFQLGGRQRGVMNDGHDASSYDVVRN